MKTDSIYYAHKFRNDLGLSLFEKIDIFDVLHKKENISVIFRSFSQESNFEGATFSKGPIAVILINSSKTLGRQIFTAAHEFFHLKLDHEQNTFDVVKGKGANTFSSHFIMPDTALIQLLTDRLSTEKRTTPDISDILYLENYFQISHQALITRLTQRELVSKETLSELQESKIIQEAKKYGYPDTLYKPTEINKTLSSYPATARELLEQGKISHSKYESLLVEGGYFDILMGN
ncbi:MAG TPA: ImmA/IrrE family metallo-endopeptidase [Deltaproteobacteria bacterium]|nr:ImmA/IrrE family metallo-endopeptidase [Deltaproteobacteria bacterium]